MTKILCFIFSLLINICFAQQTHCNCYSFYTGEIKSLIRDYEETGRKYFMDRLPPYRYKWQIKYHIRMEELQPPFTSIFSMRYPDVYQNILLFNQKIDVMKDF